MKSIALLLVSVPGFASGALVLAKRSSSALTNERRDNPIPQVLTLLEDLKAKIEADAQSEQASYDKYACWCEDTLGQKATDIGDAKAHIESLQTLIVKLNGDLGAHGAEIKQLEKDIAQNAEATKEAREVRKSEVQAYVEEKEQSEQCIGALEAAITVLASHHKAELLSVVANVQKVLKRRPTASKSVSSKDLELVRRFISRPADIVSGDHGPKHLSLSATKVAQNPFGDFAPASTQIQGVLKEMYAGFSKDLEKANVDEAKKEKGFQALMATKASELATLETTLDSHKLDEAEKSKELADSETELDDTKAQLKADEEFFASTKVSCSDKASMWAQRTRLRTEELHGIAQAVSILSSEAATTTFENATSTFLQIASHPQLALSNLGNKAYQNLVAMAAKFQSVELASIAGMAKTARTAGHFKAITRAIDAMLARLREQAGSDIKERDFCQARLYKNQITLEDLDHEIDKAGGNIERLTGEIEELQTSGEHLKEEMNATQDDIDALKSLRATERENFIQSVKADDDAIALISEAIVSLSKYYSKGSALLQTKTVKATVHTHSRRVANVSAPPETEFNTGEYTGAESATQGIVAILSVIKEDLEKEIETERRGDAQSQLQYESDLLGLNNVLSALAAKVAEIETVKASKTRELASLEEFKAMKTTDKELEDKVKESLEAKCAWVESHFDSRKDKRAAEIEGLIEAKNFLAGME